MLRFIFVAACTLFLINLYGQDPLRFKNEVDQLTAGDSTVDAKALNLFTGSSSIRLWKSLSTDFAGYRVLNRGFGGSETSDLLYYFDQLILPYHPKRIFIYEGDNDINSGKTPQRILSDFDELVKKIRAAFPRATVLFISPKPSEARWKLKEKYMVFNEQLRAWTKTHKRVRFIDVWTPALDKDGNIVPGIFLEDKLHLNRKGYDIWVKAIKPYLK